MPNKRTSFLKRHAFDILAAVVVISLILLMSSCDMQAAEAERDEYCTMVKLGTWPDYREIAKTECSR